MNKKFLINVVGFSVILAGMQVQAELNSTFKVTVKRSNGTTFIDCYRFDDPSSGDLSIDGLGQTMTYVHGKKDNVAGTGQTRFKAVTRDDEFEMSVFGKVMGPGNRIHGEVVTEAGESFVFTGSRKNSCTRPTINSSSEDSPYAN